MEWRERLFAVAEDVVDQPFAWGQLDCWIVTCLCVDAMYGTDETATWRGRYRTPAGALRAFKSVARESPGMVRSAVGPVHDYWSDRWSVRPVAPRFEQDGDFVLGVDDGGLVQAHTVMGGWLLTCGPETGGMRGSLADAWGKPLLTLRLGEFV